MFPGFKFSVCSYVVSLLRPEIIRDLQLPRFGLEIIPLECSFTPLPDGDSLCRWADPHMTRDLGILLAECRDRFRSRGWQRCNPGSGIDTLSRSC